MALSSKKPADTPRGKWLAVVGIGEDGIAGLGSAARDAIAGAAHVFGGKRHLELADSLIAGELHPWSSPFDPAMTAVTALRGNSTCVLASGDPFMHGVGANLARVIDPLEMQVFPAPSAFSLAAARMGWSLPDVLCLSLHNAPITTLRRHLQAGRRILALTSGAGAPAEIAGYLAGNGFGKSMLTVLEALGGPNERITKHRAQAFDLTQINPLNLLAIEVNVDNAATRVLPLVPGILEDLFAHDGQISKRDIRALTLSALQPRHGELLWDIGAGSGAIAIEWLLTDPSMRAIAVEERHERAANIGANAAAFGVPALEIIEGRAPEALSGLATPDAIFIGGGGSREGVIDVAIEALRPGGRLVINAVTLETERLLIDLAQRHGGNLCQLSISRAEPLGSMTTWRPALPVTQWSWCKSGRKP